MSNWQAFFLGMMAVCVPVSIALAILLWRAERGGRS
jgi:hypothetical protein